MNLIYGIKQVMHKIRVKLYPNYLPGHENTFIAHTDSEAVLDIKQICASMYERGGFKGDTKDLEANIIRYHNEAAYQLCDGFTINNGYYSIYPNLGGTFKGLRDTPDPKSNPLSFRFRTMSALRRLAESIGIEIVGFAEADAFIDEFLDTDDHSSNTWYHPGNLFSLSGNKIKIDGDAPGVGMFFVPEDGSPEVKVERLNENGPASLRGIIPNCDAERWKNRDSHPVLRCKRKASKNHPCDKKQFFSGTSLISSPDSYSCLL